MRRETKDLQFLEWRSIFPQAVLETIGQECRTGKTQQRREQTRTSQGSFLIGPMTLQLASIFQKNVQPSQAVIPVMQELVRRTKESASYFVPYGTQRICVYRVDSPHLVRDHISVGDVFSLERGAGAKIITAFRKPYSPSYAKIRRRLVVSVEAEHTPDMAGISAPVFNADGEVVAALSLSGPSSRLDRKRRRDAEPLVRESARKITANIGGDIRLFRDN